MATSNDKNKGYKGELAVWKKFGKSCTILYADSRYNASSCAILNLESKLKTERNRKRQRERVSKIFSLEKSQSFMEEKRVR